MVDSRPQTIETERTRLGDGGPFVSLVKARFVLAAMVIAAALGLGFGGRGLEESRRVAGATVPELRLDANTVPPEVLTALPHLGSALVDRWVKAREERPFRSLEDARARVRGLGAATLAQIAPYFEDPEGQRPSAKPFVSRRASRPSAKLRTALRKKSGSTKKSATRQPRLAARAPH
jgi:hypothetical protein